MPLIPISQELFTSLVDEAHEPKQQGSCLQFLLRHGHLESVPRGESLNYSDFSFSIGRVTPCCKEVVKIPSSFSQGGLRVLAFFLVCVKPTGLPRRVSQTCHLLAWVVVSRPTR